MIKFTSGNLLEAKCDALVNTVNTEGVMGKGIALMFKERFPLNYDLYRAACKRGDVNVCEMFVTETAELSGPRYVVNFPTKRHWRSPSKLEWIECGLIDLKAVILNNRIRSIAIPPLGAGNGGLDWHRVRGLLVEALSELDAVDILVFEPTSSYQNVAKREGVERLTPARALVAELVRRYSVLGLDCTLLEIQKLAWLLEVFIAAEDVDDPLKLEFKAHIYGPYAPKLNHLLNSLDGSYLHCDMRISDAKPTDVIWFDDSKRSHLSTYIKSREIEPYRRALDRITATIDGFESPFGLELLGTVGWLLSHDRVAPEVGALRQALSAWPNGGKRKMALFDDHAIQTALSHLTALPPFGDSATSRARNQRI
ncbi:macro domain-containing protein [Luteibacter sp. 329MFSha]|uniref:type II toxin-antitoxin system antitoxin DNA ADP-ribosyl glycohydrolase DarG n=1 Tax=Luteibacter sp. 329MFSha TaxID=1798239 RepID=UPI0008D10A9A|nr:macro domain-containing protein [Luteibacter sp. 329MFSha]SEW29650.1 O-acetyl-ADP-ribose deacetylase (regulator of RNase III), contains Macro domain [Luteibacter sp. 329MFSha]